MIHYDSMYIYSLRLTSIIYTCYPDSPILESLKLDFNARCI